MKVIGTISALEVHRIEHRYSGPYGELWEALDKAPAGHYVVVAAAPGAERKRLYNTLFARRKELKFVSNGENFYVARNHSTNKGGN